MNIFKTTHTHRIHRTACACACFRFNVQKCPPSSHHIAPIVPKYSVYARSANKFGREWWWNIHGRFQMEKNDEYHKTRELPLDLRRLDSTNEGVTNPPRTTEMNLWHKIQKKRTYTQTAVQWPHKSTPHTHAQIETERAQERHIMVHTQHAQTHHHTTIHSHMICNELRRWNIPTKKCEGETVNRHVSYGYGCVDYPHTCGR